MKILILIYICFKMMAGQITRGHDFTLVKVHASSSVNMFKNRIDKYLVKAGYTFRILGRLYSETSL